MESSQSFGKMDETENVNFSFNKKPYIYDFLQKGWVEELSSERLISKNVPQKNVIARQISTHKNTLKTVMLGSDLATHKTHVFK